MPYEGGVATSEMEPMLTVKEVSRMLNAHPNTVRRWSNSGIIKSVRINGRGDRRFRLIDILSFLFSQD